MRLVGIDYSYTSPACAWMEYSNKFSLDKISFVILSSKPEKYQHEKINVLSSPLNFSGTKRFLSLATQVVQKTLSDSPINYIALEDYSFGSRNGRAFTIGENCGVLKGKIVENNCLNYLRLYSPTLVKRFAKEHNEQLAVEFSDGRLKKDGLARIGALKKEAMHEILCWKLGVRLEEYWNIKFKKYISPLSDVVDSLWILYLLWCEMKIRDNNIDDLTDQEVKFIKEGVEGKGLHEKSFES